MEVKTSFIRRCTGIFLLIFLQNLVIIPYSSAQQNITSIKGLVKDGKRQAVSQASVELINTTNNYTEGTTTDSSGLFTFKKVVVGADYSIVVKSQGYETFKLEKQIFRAGTETLIAINLVPINNMLEQVVVVGYGTQRRRDITGAVSTLNANKFKDMPLPTAENAILGQMPGVQVQEPSGEPGAGPTIRIRGNGSISAGNEPLYVIDGFPITKNVASSVEGVVGTRTIAFRPPAQNPLGAINPNDIATIEVLKDAAATSIYGSRGSNGIIIITTKKGTAGTNKPLFGFDGYYGWQTVARKVDLMNANELADYVKDAKNNAYLQDIPGANANDPNSVRYTKTNNGSYYIPDDYVNLTGTNTNWQNEIFKTSPIQSYNVSVNGGSSKLSYYASTGYFDQKGIVDNSDYKRYSLRVNLDAHPTEQMHFGININPSFTKTQKASASAPYFANPPGAIYAALVTSPTVSPYLPNGTINQSDNQSHLFTENGIGANMTASSNPLAILKYIHNNLDQTNILGGLFGEYEIIEGLKYKIYTGFNINNYTGSYYRENAFLDRTATIGVPYGQSNTSQEINWLVENTLNYDKAFNGHRFSLLAGYTAQKDILKTNQVNAEKYPDDLVQTVSGGQVTGGTSTEEQWSLASMLARLNYSYNSKYLFSGTIRSDRSSRFGPDHKIGVFPSFSLGWRLKEEAFLKSVQFINDLKLRGSWGKTGNFSIPNYAAIGLLNPYNYVFNNVVVNGIGPSTPSNPNLSWEKNTQWDAGLELSVLNNRLFISVDWYKKVTSDLLLNVQIPGAIGYGSQNPLQNIGKVENKGWEFLVSSKNIVGKFSWNTDANFSINKNKVLQLGPSGDPILSEGGAGIRHITRIGDPIGSYYGYVVDGIYQNQTDIDKAPKDLLAPSARPGDFRFKDVNGDGVINANDRTVIGNYMPKYTWGVTNTISYNSFSMNFLFQGVEGSKVLNLTRRHLGNGEAATNSYHYEVNRWKSESNPGDGKTPRADRLSDLHGYNNRPSSYQVESGSYIRLRNVTLSYNLTSASLLKYFRSARLYVSASNLFTITDYIGYNPEVNNQSTNTNVQGEDYGAYPLQRVFTFGVNFSF